MLGRIKSWFSRNTPKPETLSENTVEHDAFDRMDLDEVSEAMGALRRSRERLAEASPTGDTLFEDLFFSLVRDRPELREREQVQPKSQVNWQVMSDAMELPDWVRLHAETRNDPWFAGMAATSLAPKLAALVPKLQDQQQQADRLQATVDQLADAQQEQAQIEAEMAALQPGEEPDELQEQMDALVAQVDDLTSQAQDQATQLDNAMAMAAMDVAAAAQDALTAAADQVEENKEMIGLWGATPGELQRMSTQDHIELAQKLDNEELRELAKLYGAMRYDVHGARSQKSRYVRDEVYAIEFGNDLSRVLPSELVKLKHPVRKLEFYRGYIEGDLMQYAMRGEERHGQGAIVCAIDTSISMVGMRHRWAKATSMHLWDIARQEERTFIGIVFSGPGAFKTYTFANPEDYTTDRMIEWAMASIDGGTCFMTPTDEALRIMTEEFAATGAVSGDYVLISDGECAVAPAWYEHYLSERKRLGFTTYGVLIGGVPNMLELGMGALADGGISTVQDLFSAKEVTNIYAHV